jgi:hypothetical protein
MPSLRYLPCIAAVLVAFAVGTARADIAIPEPVTVWGRNDAPTINVIVSAGLAISALVVALGLLLGRFTGVGTALAAGVSVAVLAIVWTIAGLLVWRAEADRDLWTQWEAEEGNRQRNWRGPPRFEGPLPESAPAPTASPDQDPTKVISPGDLEKLRREFQLDPASASPPPAEAKPVE